MLTRSVIATAAGMPRCRTRPWAIPPSAPPGVRPRGLAASQEDEVGEATRSDEAAQTRDEAAGRDRINLFNKAQAHPSGTVPCSDRLSTPQWTFRGKRCAGVYSLHL